MTMNNEGAEEAKQSEATSQATTEQAKVEDTVAQNADATVEATQDSTETTDTTAEQVENVEELDNATLAKKLDEVTRQLVQLKSKLAEAEDDALRARAEKVNMQRRCEVEVDKAKKYAVEKFVRDLLGAIDPMEKALEFLDPNDEALKSVKDGVESTFSLLIKALNNHGVVVVDPKGVAFDPAEHQAIQMIESADVPANHVIAVVQKGYTLNGRVVRPAMVIVSKGSSESTGETQVE